MSKRKPFKTIGEQIELLNSRGVKTNEESAHILLSEGYYTVVNGYKDPFIDKEKTAAAADDRYRDGTQFEDIYSLFLFDRSLREISFHYLLRAEALVRTVCSYTFSEFHREPNAYLEQGNFASKDEYAQYGLPNYKDNWEHLHKVLQDKAQSGQREFTAHYKEHYDDIPLWVLSNDLTFGNLEHFFNLMKPQEQTAVCKRIVDATNKLGSEYGYFSPKEARVGLDLLVKARNICAHDERLYCARFGGRKQFNYVDILVYARRYLTSEEFNSWSKSLVETVNIFSDRSDIVSHILVQMGFEEIDNAV